MRHFLQLLDVSRDDLTRLLSEASRLKAAYARREPITTLANRVVPLIFEKPSLRTRVSFEAAVVQLGGSSMYLAGNDVGLGWRESLADIARTMNHYVDAIILRVFKHETLTGLAAHATCPIINGLSDRAHPCQALADVLTIQETLGGIAGKRIAFIGDGNNVSRSLAVACGKLGASLVLAGPQGYGFDAPFLEQYRRLIGGSSLSETQDPIAAVKNADVIYTDVWTSMGQESERDERLKRFTPYQVNKALLAKAPKHAVVLHCLPAHRGEEITDEVVDGPQSFVFQQAGNRLHVQKAVLEWLLG